MVVSDHQDGGLAGFGLGDPVVDGSSPTLPDGGWRGWAGLLAESLDGAELHNIACCGAQARDVAARQLPQALAMKPAVASVIVGMNDTLRGAFSVEQIAGDLSSAVGALARTGAIVLTGRLPDPGRVLGIPDLLPTLARLVAREWWYEQRDRVAELDEQLYAELAASGCAPVPETSWAACQNCRLLT